MEIVQQTRAEDFVINAVLRTTTIETARNKLIHWLIVFIAGRRDILQENAQQTKRDCTEKEAHALDAALSDIL